MSRNVIIIPKVEDVGHDSTDQTAANVTNQRFIPKQFEVESFPCNGCWNEKWPHGFHDGNWNVTEDEKHGADAIAFLQAFGDKDQ